MVGRLDCRAALMMVVTSASVSTGVASIAMKVLWRSVDRHLGIRAAGVEGMHEVSMIRLLSESVDISRPRVGWVPLTGSVIVTDGPNGFGVNSKSKGVDTVVKTAGAL